MGVDGVRTTNSLNVCLWITVLVSLLVACVLSQGTSMCETEQYFDNSTRTCKNCTVCMFGEEEKAFCVDFFDRQCRSLCNPGFAYNKVEGCVLDCEQCEHGCISGEARCQCRPMNCFATSDRFCGRNLCNEPTATGETVTQPTGSSENALPAWGVGLISIGVVVGIVAFSGCFILLGVCTRKREPPDMGSEDSGNSQNALVTRGTYSKTAANIANSSYLFDKSALDLFRESPYIGGRGPHPSVSNVKASPRSLRGTPPRTDRSIVPV